LISDSLLKEKKEKKEKKKKKRRWIEENCQTKFKNERKKRIIISKDFSFSYTFHKQTLEIKARFNFSRPWENRSTMQQALYCEQSLKLRCDERFRHALTACGCDFKEITLVGSHQGNFFENATA